MTPAGARRREAQEATAAVARLCAEAGDHLRAVDDLGHPVEADRAARALRETCEARWSAHDAQDLPPRRGALRAAACAERVAATWERLRPLDDYDPVRALRAAGARAASAAAALARPRPAGRA